MCQHTLQSYRLSVRHLHKTFSLAFMRKSSAPYSFCAEKLAISICHMPTRTWGDTSLWNEIVLTSLLMYHLLLNRDTQTFTYLSNKFPFCTQQNSMTYVLTTFICTLLLENSSPNLVDHLLQLDIENIYVKLGVKGIRCFSEEYRVAFEQYNIKVSWTVRGSLSILTSSQ